MECVVCGKGLDNGNDICESCRNGFSRKDVEKVIQRHRKFVKKDKTTKELLKLDQKLDSMKKEAIELERKIGYLEGKKLEQLKIINKTSGGVK